MTLSSEVQNFPVQSHPVDFIETLKAEADIKAKADIKVKARRIAEAERKKSAD